MLHAKLINQFVQQSNFMISEIISTGVFIIHKIYTLSLKYLQLKEFDKLIKPYFIFFITYFICLHE